MNRSNSLPVASVVFCSTNPCIKVDNERLNVSNRSVEGWLLAVGLRKKATMKGRFIDRNSLI